MGGGLLYMKKDKKIKVELKHNKYLEKLGFDTSSCRVTSVQLTKKRRKQIKEYGFCDIETYNLDMLFFQWLYSHLKMYKDLAGKVVDLGWENGIEIRVPSANKDNKEKEVIRCSLLRAINILIDMTEKVLKDMLKGKDIDSEECKNICEIWGVILPYMWW